MSTDRETLGRPPTSSPNALLVLALVLLTGGLMYQTWSQNSALLTGADRSGSGQYVPRNVEPRGELLSSEAENIAVFQRSAPSVVFIRTKGFQPYLFGGVQEQELSSGTGFVWDRQGHIVTNLHVVEDALTNSSSILEVQFDNKEVVDAEVVGGVREHDIAILRVVAAEDRLLPISLGTSDDLQVGQTVLAIGSPFGFDQTLSTGVIGGLNRSVPTKGGKGLLDGLIQTDAAINPGNSGGPLLDSAGRMIGVNTAIVSPTGSYSGLGFAVPVSSVIASVNLVLEQSNGPQAPVLGITVLSPEQAAQWGIPQEILDRGLFIKQLDPSGPAAGTALRSTEQHGYRIYLGDQIAEVDGEPVTTLETLQAVLKSHRVGDVVTLKIFRGNLPGTIEITLQARKLIF
ncbi:MAG: trypsin-like peptidase domain-containing protein [Planctomycetaceae bacterium]